MLDANCDHSLNVIYLRYNTFGMKSFIQHRAALITSIISVIMYDENKKTIQLKSL